MKDRIYVVTGSASGIGAATARWIKARGGRVLGVDLHDAEIITDLSTADGRAMMIDGVDKLSDGRIDGVVANAGGGRPETMLQLNYYGAISTLEELRPFLAKGDAPRAVVISSIASLGSPPEELVESCLAGNEAATIELAHKLETSGELLRSMPRSPIGSIYYATAKRALNRWCRRVAPTPEWGGAGICVNAVPLGYYDTPAAAYILDNPRAREKARLGVPLRGSFPGRPDAVAELIGWLISPANTQLTGQILFADGGYEVGQRGRI